MSERGANAVYGFRLLIPSEIPMEEGIGAGELRGGEGARYHSESRVSSRGPVPISRWLREGGVTFQPVEVGRDTYRRRNLGCGGNGEALFRADKTHRIEKVG